MENSPLPAMESPLCHEAQRGQQQSCMGLTAPPGVDLASPCRLLEASSELGPPLLHSPRSCSPAVSSSSHSPCCSSLFISPLFILPVSLRPLFLEKPHHSPRPHLHLKKKEQDIFYRETERQPSSGAPRNLENPECILSVHGNFP